MESPTRVRFPPPPAVGAWTRARFGNRPVLMTFDGDRLETNELRVNQPLYFVIVDLQAKKDTLEILNRLNVATPSGN